MKVLISGGTGMVGSALKKDLEKQGHQVNILSRGGNGENGIFHWDPSKKEIDIKAFEGVDAIVHLAGANVADGRWTESRKQLIIDSRKDSSELLVSSLEQLKVRPSVFISASAIGYYGEDTGEMRLDENSPAGSDFLAKVCSTWERSVEPVKNLGLRLAIFRIGVVLGKEGGAIAKMLEAPVLSPLGTGKQYMSWIHINDLTAMMIMAIENPKMEGVYNGVAPNPATNKDFTIQLAKAASKIYLPVHAPAFVLRLALGQMSNIVLGGTLVTSIRLKDVGFEFEFSELKAAFNALFKAS
jgi:uncharacterized protein